MDDAATRPVTAADDGRATICGGADGTATMTYQVKASDADASDDARP
jgi:hypothetical protein